MMFITFLTGSKCYPAVIPLCREKQEKVIK